MECRLFHLTIELFYNDRLFHEVIKFLKLHGVSAFSWLMAIHEQRDRLPYDLSVLYRGFSDETRGELWESKKELEEFAKRPDTITRYVSGEFGSNLIFKYKALAIFNSARSLHEVAYETAKTLLARAAPDALAHYESYLLELRRFSEHIKADLMDMSQALERRFAYDFEGLAERKFECLPDEFYRREGVVHYFFHDRVQREMIAAHLRQYGNDLNGRARILAKVYVKHLYRKHSPAPATLELEKGIVPIPAESRLF